MKRMGRLHFAPPYGTGFLEGKTVTNSGGQGGQVQKGEGRQVEIIVDLHAEFFPDTGVSAVFDHSLYIGRKIFAGSHHYCCCAHGNAHQDYLGLGVLLAEKVNPLQHIFSLLPSHTDVFAFAVPVSSGIGKKHGISSVPEVSGIHAQLTAVVAVAVA